MQGKITIDGDQEIDELNIDKKIEETIDFITDELFQKILNTKTI